MNFIKFSTLIVLVFLPATISWRKVPQFNKQYHQRDTNHYSFQDAKSYCNSKDAILWQPYSKEESEYIQGGIQYIWIGMTRDAPNDPFRWINNSSSTYSNWQSGQPEATDVFAYSTNSKWLGSLNDGTNTVICERPYVIKLGDLMSEIQDLAGKDDLKTGLLSSISSRLTDLETKIAFLLTVALPAISQTGWTEVPRFNKKYHQRGTIEYSFQDAKSYCNSKGAILWQPYSKEETEFIHSDIRNIWIGMISDASNSPFNWIELSSSTYSNWRFGGTGIYAYSTKSEWVRTYDGDTNTVICERPIEDLMSEFKAIAGHFSSISLRLTDLETKIRTDISALSNEIGKKMATLTDQQQCSAVIDFEPID